MEKAILAQRRARPGIFLVFIALVAAVLIRAVPAPAVDQGLFRDIDRILAGLSEITGWKIRRPVPAEYIGKDKLRAFLEQRIREEVKPEDIRIEELALKMFGLVPENFDLRKTTIDLISEQAAAFYDPHRKKLAIIDVPGSVVEQRAALAHELAHALADQQFHLERFIRKASENDDASTARQAVMEGQATWLMWAYTNSEGGGEATVGPAALAAMEGLADSTSSQYPVLESAPLYLRESLMFPYTRGLRFQDAVFRKLGKRAFSEVFERPPSSTRQILHPEEYLAHRDEPIPALPEIPDSRQYRKLAEGTLGELDIDILLRQYGTESEARRISTQWRGGSFALLESKRESKPLLAFAAVWSNEEAASEFFTAYQNVLRKKWARLDEERKTSAELAGTGDRGRFELRISGSRITSVEGMR